MPRILSRLCERRTKRNKLNMKYDNVPYVFMSISLKKKVILKNLSRCKAKNNYMYKP